VNGAATDEMVAKVNSGGTVYYHQDGLGSMVALTDTTGNVVEGYTYDIYGAPTITDGSGNLLATSRAGNRFMFTGREYIAELGLYDYRNRVYSSFLEDFCRRIRFVSAAIRSRYAINLIYTSIVLMIQ